MPQASARSFLLTLVVALGLGLAPGSASAGLLVATATSCEASSASQVFAPWVDPANYVLAPGGTAESSAHWSLNGATVVEGNEPWNVVGATDHRSLRINPGGSATTGSMCVGVEHPTLRLFTRATGTNAQSSMRVDVLFEDSLGVVGSATIGVVTPDEAWSPTQAMAVFVNMLPLLPGEKTAVAFRFVPQGIGAWQIDDVHVDPWYTR